MKKLRGSSHSPTAMYQIKGTWVVKFASLVLALSFIVSPFAPVFAQEGQMRADISTSPAESTPNTEVSGSEAKPLEFEVIPEASEILEPQGEVLPAYEEDTDSNPESQLPVTEEEVLDEEGPEEVPVDSGDSLLSGETNDPINREIGRFHKTDPNDSTGSFEYDFPIPVPPGRNGIEPSLSLTYSSAFRDAGIFGYGWSINIPKIQRINRKGTEDLFSQTAFSSSLDSELVQTGSTTYQARSDTGAFRSYTFSSNSWTVNDKDGLVYKFGTSSASRLDDTGSSSNIFAWYVSEIRDQNNNYIRFEYEKDNGQIYPSAIYYTGNNVTDGIFKVEFERELRSDIATTSDAGFEVVTKYRIYEIRAEINNSWSQKVEIDYQVGKNEERSLIESLTISGRDDSNNIIELPPETYTYTEATSTFSTSSQWLIPEMIAGDGSNWSNDLGVRFVDINGDSLTDIVRSFYGSSATERVYLNDGDSWNVATWTVPAIISYQSTDKMGVRFADVNGDQLVDFLVSYDDSSDEQDVYINDGDSWEYDASWVLPEFHVRFSSDQGVRYAEVNGDGLIDIVRGWNDNGSITTGVYLNNGHGWDGDPSWSFPSEFSKNGSDQGVRMVDVNSDGLSDVVKGYGDQGGETIKTYINNGHGWDEDPTWDLPVSLSYLGQDQGVRFADMNRDGLIDVVQGYANQSNTYTDVYINTGKGWVGDNSWDFPYIFSYLGNDQGVELLDIEGNGAVDVLEAYINSTSTSFNSNDFELLKHIDHIDGGDTSITYKHSPLYRTGGSMDNPRLPFGEDTVSVVEHSDGQGGTMRSEYQYGGGSYYYAGPFNRQFGGFATTTKTNGLGFVTKIYSHQGSTTLSTLGEYDDHESKIGKPYRIEMYDGENNLYQQTINKWDRYAINASSSFVKLASTTVMTYDGDSDHKDTAIDYIYENTTGNLLTKNQWGEVTASTNGSFTDTGSDKRINTYTYASTSSSTIRGLLAHDTLTNQSGTKIAEIKNYYDLQSIGTTTKGNLTKQEQWATSTTYIDVERTYDTYGLVTQEKDPRDKATNFTYDTYNLYPATTTNPLSQTVYQEYDYSSGKVTKKTDENTREFRWTYDGLDRVTEEKQPDITTPSTLVIARTYTYGHAFPMYVMQTDHLDATTSVAQFTYFDGLGRVIQKRAKAPTGSQYFTVDTAYDRVGNVSTTSLPYFSNGASSTNMTNSRTLLIDNRYDPLGRKSISANAVGTSTYAYDQWAVGITDPEGNLKTLTSDAFNNLVTVTERNGNIVGTTTYTYNAKNDLTNITDAASNVRAFTYDGLGRRLKAEDLHASSDTAYGSSTYAYDSSSNLSTSTDPKGQVIAYTYDDLNRVTAENYTASSGIEIAYAYDTCTNGKGHLCAATTSGSSTVTTYEYDALGRQSKETKKIDGTSYVTQFVQNRRGDITQIVYPDSSDVIYTYNDGGLPETIKRKESIDGSYSTVFWFPAYEPTGALEYFEFGDSTTVFSSYDENELYRLRYTETTAPDEGESGSGMFMFVGGDADGSLENKLEFHRGQTEGKLKQLLRKTSKYARSFAETDSQGGSLSAHRVSYDKNAPRKQATTKEEAAFYKKMQKEKPAPKYQQTAWRTPPEFQVLGFGADQPPRDSTNLKSENLWFTESITNNQSFEDNLDGWDTWSGNGATIARDCTVGYDGNCSVKAVVPSVGNNWDTVLQQILRVDPNVSYRFSFKAKATSSTSFIATVGMDHDPWLDYGIFKVIDVGTDWQEYEFTFRSVATGTDELSKVYFGLGEFTGTIYIDDVTLTPDDMTVIRNASFEDGGLAEWNSWANGGIGTFTSDCTYFTDGECAAKITASATGTYVWELQLNHSDISVTATDTYIVEFDAKATSSRDIQVAIVQDNDPWAELTPEVNVPITSEWVRYSVEFDPSAAESDARLSFFFAGDTETVYLDNVRFWRVKDTKITDMTPELSAIYDDPDTGDTALSYQIQVIPDWGDFSDPMWDSGKTGMGSTSEGARMADKSYDGDTLYENDSRYYWRIKLWDQDDNEGEWTNGLDYFTTAGDRLIESTYAYDRLGNVTQILDGSNTASEHNYVYEYDDLSRLINVAEGTGAPATSGGRVVAAGTSTSQQAFTYDKLGSIASSSVMGVYLYQGTSTGNYANPHAATKIGSSVTYWYDKNGNLASTTAGNRYTWNYRNEMTAAYVPGSGTTTFAYDHTGQRVKLGATTTHRYANKFYDTDGTTPTKNIYRGDTLIATVEGTGADAVVHYVHTDHLGSTRAVTEHGGARSQILDYWPHGSTRVERQYGEFDERNRFTGHDFDEGTGLNYMEARYQDPEEGRFVSQDPAFLRLGELSFKQTYGRSLKDHLSNPQRLNSYSYTLNNPLTMIDPNGEDAWNAFLQSIRYADSQTNASTQTTIRNELEGYKQAGKAIAAVAAGSAAIAVGPEIVAVSVASQPEIVLGAAANTAARFASDYADDGKINDGAEAYGTSIVVGAGASYTAAGKSALTTIGITMGGETLEGLSVDGETSVVENSAAGLGGAAAYYTEKALTSNPYAKMGKVGLAAVKAVAENTVKSVITTAAALIGGGTHED